MTQALSARALDVRRRGRAAVVGRRRQSRAAASGSGSGCGRRRRRSPAAPRRCSARSSATGCSACRAERAHGSLRDAWPRREGHRARPRRVPRRRRRASLAFYCDDARPRARARRRVARAATCCSRRCASTPTTIIDLFGRDSSATGAERRPLLPGHRADRSRRARGASSRTRSAADGLFGAQGYRVEPLRPRPRRQHHRAEDLRDRRMSATEVLLTERAALCDTLDEVRPRRADVVRGLAHARSRRAPRRAGEARRRGGRARPPRTVRAAHRRR